MTTFDSYIDNKFGKDLKDIEQQDISKSHINELLGQYKEIVFTNIIQQFGLGTIFDIYKRGGNVTTLHNAEKLDYDLFQSKEDEERFKQNYSQDLRKELYEKDFKNNRKKAFQENDVIYDDYTGKILNKDGRTHRDHIVSAAEIQQNNKARLYMSDEERGAMAVDEKI